MNTDYFFIRHDKKYIRINVNEIIYIEGLKDYVVIHTLIENIIVSMNIKTIYSKLDHNIFYRIHRSIIVNVEKISAIEKNKVYLYSTVTVLPIGYNYSKELKNFIKTKLLKKDGKIFDDNDIF